MTRQLIRNNVPELWRQRANAGLCPVCAKTKPEFDKGMIVYCSVKCRQEYAGKYEFWVTLRENVMKRDLYTCQKCGINSTITEAKHREYKSENIKNFVEKERKEFEIFRDIELTKLSEKYEREYNEIMDDITLFSRNSWELSNQFEKQYPDVFSRGYESPSFEVDHIKALMNGGAMWDIKNLQTLCKNCHKQKTRSDFNAKTRL